MKNGIAVAGVVTAMGLFWGWQCLVPPHPLVRESLVVPGDSLDGSVDIDLIVAKYLPIGMKQAAVLGLLREAGFDVIPHPNNENATPPCPECDVRLVARHENLWCGLRRVSLVLGFREGHLLYRESWQVRITFGS